MNELNPLATTILGGLQQQQIIGIDRSRQLRRSKLLENNVAAEDEQMESEVDNAEAVKAIQAEDEHQQHAARRDDAKEPKDEKPHIDIRG